MTRTTCIFCLSFVLGVLPAGGQDTNAPAVINHVSKFRSPEDGLPDFSEFLADKFGFLPVVIPITEPAVGYGAGGGLAFIGKPLDSAGAGYGRPNITMLGGLVTDNGTWGAVVGDVRHWLDDRLQTVAGVVYASANLDFYGIGENAALAENPLGYNLEPIGGTLQAKYRLSKSRFWGGLSANSVQVMRRMKALTCSLLAALPAERRPALRQWDLRLQRTVARAFADTQEKLDASVPDRQGLGIGGRGHMELQH